jgi:all-trans-retinol 13,14-reductase
MKHLYSSELAKRSYDTIIIGSGLGGLSTAVMLSKAGQKVLVLEKHYVAGGFTHTFKRKKFEWDVGVHYVGQVNQEESILRKAFDFLSDKKLHWADMGEVYDQAIIEGDLYNFRTGRENQINQIIAYFPEEEKAIRAYYDLIQKVGGASILYFSERTMPPWLSNTVGYFMRKSYLKYAHRTTYEVLRELTANEKLISLFCAQCGNYGLPPKESSFAIHAIVADHFVEGGNYPVGGASKIGDTLIDVIEANGGSIAIKAPVKKILLEKNKAIGVEMENGDKLYARNIVSNAGAHNTYLHLIPNPSPEYAEALNNIAPSVSHVCLYVGLNASDAELNLPKYNIWSYDSYAFDREHQRYSLDKNSTPPLAYISFPSAKDPDWPISHPNMSTIQVVTSCPFEWVEEWKDKKWQKRGEDYEAFKERMSQMLLEKLYKAVPQVKGKVEYYELSTPISTRHFSNYAQGEIYGLTHDTNRAICKYLRPTTPYQNLFITGQDIVCVGVGSSMFSGLITSMAILKGKSLRLFKEMMFPKTITHTQKTIV